MGFLQLYLDITALYVTAQSSFCYTSVVPFGRFSFFFHLEGIETIPCPEFLSRSNFFKVIWNFPKFLFPSFLCFNLMIQIMWLCFFSIGKEDWARVIVLCLQLWIYISMFRSRTKIRMLTENLYRISNMLHAHTLQKKMMKICIWLYGLFVISGTAFLEVTIFRSGMVSSHN
ncbi:hypothetical protein CDAR_216681 [Caerostris darwini]|uniref:Uncharacterized protein n=1 Tax=Caerostris darwini TaxID=1538125 RepID=A0AAV4QHS8_9ARAC|nr:hypothetical protein CDAR_216681 [Caerostris darwini]